MSEFDSKSSSETLDRITAAFAGAVLLVLSKVYA